MTFMPIDDIALWNLVEGPEGIYLSQIRPALSFYPWAPPQDQAAAALCTMSVKGSDPNTNVWSHPFLCGRIGAPDHHGTVFCAYHYQAMYTCQCCGVWIGDDPNLHCAACQGGACGGQHDEEDRAL
ncbi:MAG: hypothetical protein AB7R40_25285 [Nitrospiraceae bacterium]